MTLTVDNPKTPLWSDTDTALFKAIPIDDSPYDLFPFPEQTEEIANEPTASQLRQFWWAQTREKARNRGEQIWAWLGEVSKPLDHHPHTQRAQDFFDAATVWAARQWRRYTYKGEFRGDGRARNRVVGRHHCDKKQEQYTASTPDDERTYDLSADDWARKLQTQINNAKLINEGAPGPLAKE